VMEEGNKHEITVEDVPDSDLHVIVTDVDGKVPSICSLIIQ